MKNEFSILTTPASLKSSVLAYQKQDETLLWEQLNHSDRYAHKSTRHSSPGTPLRVSFRILLISIILVVLSCGCVLAYDVLSGRQYFKISRSIYSHFFNTPEDLTQPIGQSVTDGNLTITCTRIIAQDTQVCCELKVETVDGSPICDTEETSDSFAFYNHFQNVTLLIDGEANNSSTDGYTILRTDDQSIPSQATYELVYLTDTSLLGKDLTLNLQNVITNWKSPMDTTLTDASLSTLLKGAELADNSTFTPYYVNNETSKTPSTTSTRYDIPPVGVLRIPLFQDYDDCYIDNVGIGDCEIMGQSYACFYIGITVGSTEEMKLCKQILAYNTFTGELPSTVLTYNPYYDTVLNRIILVLVPGRDNYWDLINGYNDTQSIVMSQLSAYHLACLDQSSLKGAISYHGNWSFNFKIQDDIVQIPKTAENVSFTLADKGMIADTCPIIHADFIQANTLNITLVGSITPVACASQYNENQSIYDLELIYSNGSTTTMHLSRLTYSGESGGTGAIRITWNDSSVIDLSDLVAVQFCGVTVEVK